MIGFYAAGAMGAGGPPPTYSYLDDLSPLPAVVWSMRKLISTATVAIRVRRSSDDAEQDIGFDGDDLDGVALSAFIGSDSAFIRTVYDQTGGGVHWGQTTATKQPRIANAGVIDDAWKMDGVDDALASSSNVPQSGKYSAVYSRIRVPSFAGSAKIILEMSTNYNLAGGSAWVVYTESDGLYTGFANTNVYNSSALTPPTAMTTLSILFDKTTAFADQQAKLYSNGTPISPSGSTMIIDTDDFVSNAAYGGGRAGTSLYSAVDFETIAIYAANTASIRSQIEAIITPS